MLKKQLVLLLSLMWIFTITAFAKGDNTKEYFLKQMLDFSQQFDIQDKEVPEGYEECNKTFLAAAKKGIITFDEALAQDSNIIKQDAVRSIYKILVAADPQFKITAEQADEILNACYDNAYLKEENRIAYASMIRHGVIGTRGKTYPDKVLTKDNVDLIMERVSALFEKRLPITVGDATISVGSSIEEMYIKFGEPARIEKSGCGFDWYVYNSNYKDFIMVGVEDDIVCAFFTNAQSLNFCGLTYLSTEPLPIKQKGLETIRNPQGGLEAVYYIPSPVEEQLDSAIHSSLSVDIINAHRVKNNLVSYVSTPQPMPLYADDNSTNRSATIQASDSISMYVNLVRHDDGDNVLSHMFEMSAAISVVSTGENMWEITAFDTYITTGNILKSVSPRAEEKKVADIQGIKAPLIVSPEQGKTINSEGIKFQLKERAADRYLIKVYNKETEVYDVFAYITTDNDYIQVPSYMLTAGNMYRACIISVDGMHEKPGNTVEFTYGQAEVPLEVASPLDNLSTYEDELQVSVYSSAYKDFRIDVYDSKDMIVSTKELCGQTECTLDALSAGTYYICVTAVSHATGEDKAQQFSKITIKQIVPQIKQIVLEEGARYDFYYGDEKSWLYFYDIESVQAGDNTYKTKITQRKVPATSKYKALREIIPYKTYIVGTVSDALSMPASTDTGDAIAALALSYQGVPYVWGGTTPKGFDCSGLVKYVCNSLGITGVARTSAEQFAKSGVFVDKKDIIPGDLLFFQRNGKIHHVGIYIGNNKMVHAPQTGDVVKISGLSDSYYLKEYAGAKRVSR